MQDTFAQLRSIPGVVEVTWYPPRDASAPAPASTLLIELPHGATRRSDYDAVQAQLRSTLPAELERFFFVNTDIGTPEGAAHIAKALSTGPAGERFGVLVLRCLLPRTFIDTNRVIAASTAGDFVGGMTPALPSYVTAAEDRALLVGLYRRYHELVARAYAAIPGEGGLALQLHSYAPRSVGIDRIDDDIVKALRRAYAPGVHETWPERPAVDLITADDEGTVLGPPAVIARLREEYAKLGIVAKENESYRLTPIAMGYQYAAATPGRVLCIELNRGLLADPFIPLEDSPIGAAKVETMVGPLVIALREALARNGAR
jgi:hypothetical protein